MKMRKSPMKLFFAIIPLLLSGCANRNQLIKDVNVIALPTERCASIAIVFVKPYLGFGQNPNFIADIKSVGADNPKILNDFSDRMVGYFSENGVKSVYADFAPDQASFRKLIENSNSNGHCVAISRPVSTRVQTTTSQYSSFSLSYVLYETQIFSTEGKNLLNFKNEMNIYFKPTKTQDSARAVAENWLKLFRENNLMIDK
jgi:hypothetical protein